MLLICILSCVVMAIGMVELLEELLTIHMDLTWIGCIALGFYFLVAVLIVFVPSLPLGVHLNERLW